MSGSVPSSDLVVGGGEMGALIRSTDWSRTSFGPIDTWPQSLRTAVNLALESRFAMVVAWGPRFRFFYNDRYRPVLGSKHPAALGMACEEIFPEIWPVVGPEFERVRRGESFDVEDWNLPIERHGYLENCWFTLTYSPIRDDRGAVEGVLAVVVETTRRVESERRLATLRDLGAAAAGAQSDREACASAAAVFSRNGLDVPFALFYLVEDDGRTATLAHYTGIPEGHPAIQERIDLRTRGTWPLADAAEYGVQVIGLADRFAQPLPGGDCPEPAESAIVLALSRPGHGDHPSGFIVSGVSPRRRLDDAYRTFFVLAADHVAAAITNARAHEAERRRAESLAELDRAKTAFFSNISHEFRTPLTLMLGPTEDALAAPDQALTGADLDIVHRNQLRLLKLVNTLLEFSRIEAGRAEATFEATRLPELTADLSSAFRSAIERGGITFEVDCQPFDEPVYVDRQMWEKIVLNLLSNAFKYTFEGTIRVALRCPTPNRVELSVSDTGIGIPESEQPMVFDRFHRIEGARGRTMEGSGIGLALVRDLVALHGGEIRVASRVGEGSTFTVSLPTGAAHLPADRVRQEPRSVVGPIGAGSEVIVAEALRWLPETRTQPGSEAHPGAHVPDIVSGARVLVVDDNRDMREYLRRLLPAEWTITLASDGHVASQAVREAPPDLVLTDVMMPGLDGFEFIRALRADERTASVPVVVLSARAGDEARLEGLARGANDYVVKPFSARELVMRLNAQLILAAHARERGDLLAREQSARQQAEAANRAKDEFLALLGHELRNPLAPIMTALQLMQRRGGDAFEKERAIIDRQTKQLVRLVDDLLDVSRIARRLVELRRERTELADIVGKAIETAAPMLEHRQHELQVNLPATGLAIDADPARFAQIVTNLLGNAVKFTGPRGRITITGWRDGHDVCLSVRDNGIGIEPSMLARVFDMFTQEEQAIDRAHGGLGLGLTIVRSLTELHGGTVRAYSKGRGTGAEFVVRVPAAGEPVSGGD